MAVVRCSTWSGMHRAGRRARERSGPRRADTRASGVCHLHLGYDRTPQGRDGRAPCGGEQLAARSARSVPSAAGDRVLQNAPFSFDVSVWELFWPLLSGARLVMTRPGGHREPGYLCELIRARRVTTAQFVPSMLRSFLDDGAAASCSSLRRVVSWRRGARRERGARFLRVCLPDVELANVYGPTEAAIQVTAWRCGHRRTAGDHPDRPPDRERADLHPGQQPASRCRSVSRASSTSAAFRCARGYLHRAELTAERFIASPFVRRGPVVQDRRSGAVLAGRHDRVSGPQRLPGEDPRLPHRAG